VERQNEGKELERQWCVFSQIKRRAADIPEAKTRTTTLVPLIEIEVCMGVW